MDLKGALLNNKPRENSGSSSANRFQFQKDWALCKLLELQLDDKEYVMILDFHDDILIVDSDTAPTVAKFYQIKTKKNSHWSLANLISRKDGSNSILGKMYHNKILFTNHDTEMNFVSNAHYKLNLKNEKSPDASLHYKDICINCLDNKSIEKISKKLVDEWSLTNEPDFKDITYLRVTELGIESHVTYTKGRLSEYFDEVDSESKVNPATAYRMLSTELAKKNDYEWKLQSFDEIINFKGVTKKTFEKLLNDLITHSQVYNDWNSIENNLLNTGLGLKEIKKLKYCWRSYDIERFDKNNLILQDMREQIIILLKEKQDFLNYRDLIDTVFKAYREKYCINNILYDEHYIKAMILMEYCLC